MNLNLKDYQIPENLKLWRDEQDLKQKAHVGTHIDVYNNSTIKKEFQNVRGIVIDVRGVVEIGVRQIEDEEIKSGDFVIFRTGYMEKYGYGAKEYFNSKEAPFLKVDLIDELIKRKISFVGIDLHGVQHGKDHKKIDIYCEEKGVYVVENLVNLDKIKTKVDLKLNWQQENGESAIPLEIEVVE